MNYIVRQMSGIYKCDFVDWFGYEITPSNPLTYHHIFKNVYGDYSRECPNYKLINGALLTKNGHNYIHLIESRDLELYVKLSKLLHMINEQQHAPTLEQYKVINDCLKYFETNHFKDTNSKGKKLLTYKHYNRTIYSL